ncbi:MAG TPA: hypothetical protein VE860_13780 [Chthoniobacterales bacterium]|nr:hypothetical protein [Chthoniobacterales bacterium]
MFTEYCLLDKSPGSVLKFAHATCVSPGTKLAGLLKGVDIAPFSTGRRFVAGYFGGDLSRKSTDWNRTKAAEYT